MTRAPMDDDRLRQLGSLERENEARHPRVWEDVVAGTRTADEARALSEGISSDDLDRYADLFRPMGEDETEALVDTLQAALARGKDETHDETHVADGLTATNASPGLFVVEGGKTEDPPLSVAPTDGRPPSRTWMTAVAGLVAIAAALALYLRPADPQGSEGADAALSPFSLVVRNETVRFDRSAAEDPSAPARYRGDSRIHWLLSPDDALSSADADALKVRAWAIPDGVDGTPRTLDLDRALTISDSGVVELRGTFGDLFALAPGRWTIQIAIGVGDLPETPKQARSDKEAKGSMLLPSYAVEVID